MSIARSNGASWSAVDDPRAIYISTRVVIDGEQVFPQGQGSTGARPTTSCTAVHYGATWVVELVATH